VNPDVWRDRAVAAAFSDGRAARVPFADVQIDVLLRLLGAAAVLLRHVIDLGAGDGLLLATILDAFPDARGIAVDFSSEMLARARDRLAPFGSRAAVREGDLGSPTWRRHVPGPADAVVSGFAIHHLPDARKRELFAEIRDMLVPGGVFLDLEHVASATTRVAALADDAMIDHQWLRRRERGEPITRDAVRTEYLGRPDQAANILAPVDVQCGWLRELGFVDVDCHWKWFELALFGGVRPTSCS
jgi:SAM-dependent methyltransferase